MNDVTTERNVYFAKITRRPLGLWPFRDDLLGALDPQHRAARYGRTWRFSHPVEMDGFVVAKLGFVKSTRALGLSYDEEKLDFVPVEGTASEGSFSLFVVDLQREIVAFEERPPAIKLTSFLGAFAALLREAGFMGSVALLPDTADFHTWVARMDRIATVRVVVERPNPAWHPRAALLRQAVEQSDARSVELVANAGADESINPDAEWIEGGLDQLAEHGQGLVTALGFIGSLRDRWRSGTRHRMTSIPTEAEQTPEHIWSLLIQKVRDLYGG